MCKFLFLTCSLQAVPVQGLDRLVHGAPGSAQLLLLLLCSLEVLLTPEGGHVLEVGLMVQPGPFQLGLVFPHLDVVVPEESLKVVEWLQQEVEGRGKPHRSKIGQG